MKRLGTGTFLAAAGLMLLASITSSSAGRLLWSQNVRDLVGSDVVIRAEAVVSGGKVFVVTQKGFSDEAAGYIISMDANNGKILWQTKLPGWGAYNQGVAVDGGKVYVGWSDKSGDAQKGSVYALSADTGKVLWNTPLQAGDGWAGAPRVKDGKVFLATFEGKAYALAEDTGKILWRTSLNGYSGSVPVVADIDGDKALEVVFTRSGGTTNVLSIADGKEEWASVSAYWLITGPVYTKIGSDTAVIQLSVDNTSYKAANLRALDSLSGAVIWDAGDIKVSGGAVTYPAVAGGKVLFGTFGQDASKAWTAKSVSAYDLKNGKLAWTKTLSSGVVASPSVTSGGQVLVATADTVYALNLADGSQVWSEPVDAGVSDPPGGIAISGSTAIFASYNGTVYAFKLDSKDKSDWPLRGGDANTGSCE